MLSLPFNLRDTAIDNEGASARSVTEMVPDDHIPQSKLERIGKNIGDVRGASPGTRKQLYCL